MKLNATLCPSQILMLAWAYTTGYRSKDWSVTAITNISCTTPCSPSDGDVMLLHHLSMSRDPTAGMIRTPPLIHVMLCSFDTNTVCYDYSEGWQVAYQMYLVTRVFTHFCVQLQYRVLQLKDWSV